MAFGGWSLGCWHMQEVEEHYYTGGVFKGQCASSARWVSKAQYLPTPNQQLEAELK